MRYVFLIVRISSFTTALKVIPVDTAWKWVYVKVLIFLEFIQTTSSGKYNICKFH